MTTQIQKPDTSTVTGLNNSNKTSAEKEEIKSDSIKHPLEYSWTLWYDYPGKKTQAELYDKFLQKIQTFSTVCYQNPNFICYISPYFLMLFTMFLHIFFFFCFVFQVEDFWSVNNFILKPSSLPQHGNYRMVFHLCCFIYSCPICFIYYYYFFFLPYDRPLFSSKRELSLNGKTQLVKEEDPGSLNCLRRIQNN